MIDKEFRNYAKQINAKIKAAAKALKEANALAQKSGLEYGLINSQFVEENMRYHEDLTEAELEVKCEEMREKIDLIDVTPLEDEMNHAGWSSSSSYC